MKAVKSLGMAFVIACWITSCANHTSSDTTGGGFQTTPGATPAAPSNRMEKDSNLPEVPLSPINNSDNFGALPDRTSAPDPANSSAPNKFSTYRVYAKKINVYGNPTRRAPVIGWLKKNSVVQGVIRGEWAELRGTGFVETRFLFPPKVAYKKRGSVSHAINPPSKRRVAKLNAKP